MPNWVRNEVTFEGDKEQIKRLLDTVKPDGGVLGQIDFNKVVPMPEELDIEVGSDLYEGEEMYRTFLVAEGCGLDVDIYKRWAEEHPKKWALGKRAVANKVDYGARDWYDWRLERWGTKWNAQNLDDEASDYLHFETAWSCPREALTELSRQFPDVAVHVLYADEDIGNNCGGFDLEDGEVQWEIEFGSEDERVEFACTMWGLDPEEYQNGEEE